LAFTAGAWRRGPLLSEHTAGRTYSIERVGFAARATLPPQPADLEHPLTTAGEEACQAGPVRPRSLDRERAATRSVLLDEPQSICIPLAARGDIGLEHDRPADDVHDREGV